MKVLALVSILTIVILAIVSVKTIIPGSNGIQNLLGYRTCCPFTPASTIIGIAAVVILFIVAKRITLI